MLTRALLRGAENGDLTQCWAFSCYFPNAKGFQNAVVREQKQTKLALL